MVKQRILPALLESDHKQAADKLTAIAGFTDCIQVDLADGSLVKDKTLPLKELLALTRDFHTEYHLMVDKPKRYFLSLAAGKVKSCVLHHESYADNKELLADIETLRSLNIEPVLTWWPDARPTIIPAIKRYQIMGVVPGKSGQAILSNTRQRIVNLKQQVAQGVMISLDGGVTDQVVKDLTEYIDLFVVNSFLYRQQPRSQWRLLQAALK